jgi:3-hydroxyacyl-CoA dehydrogenase
MNIRKTAVIGSGTMGAAVAAHLANAGIPVLLLDIVKEGAKDRNSVAREGLMRAQKAKPAALMHPSRANLITLGNLEDDLAKLRDVDWVFEAVLERLDVKQALWQKVEAAAGEHTILSSNSSGIPMHLQAEGRSESFQRRFVGTHFFNPPRYLKLLEVIPTDKTDQAVIDAVASFGDRVLGKGVVIAKDVAGFIANRIGVYGMVHTMRAAIELEIAPDVADMLLGPLIGRASSASFRTNDLSGLDIGLAVAKNLAASTDYDYTPPPLLEKLVELNRLGEKTGEGFFKRIKRDGQSVILTLNYNTLEYEEKGKVRLAVLEGIRTLPTPLERTKALLKLQDNYGEFLRRNIAGLIWFAASNIPACANDFIEVDNALKWGFNWEIGPFELCDGLGLVRVAELLAAQGLEMPVLLAEKLASDQPKFYSAGVGNKNGLLILKDLKTDANKVIKTSGGASLLDLGDGVALVEFHSKANALGEDAMRMLQYAMKVVPQQFVGLVVGNQGENFSAGANLAALLMNAQDGEWDDIDLSIRMFQKMTTSLRYAPFPTVTAPFGLALGGGCEMSLYADQVQAHSELYMGLVELGVGLIPGGGGTTEMLVRFSDALLPGEDPFSAVQKAFELMALAKTSASALEARELGFLRPQDGISMNRDRLLDDAKRKVLALVPDYLPQQPRQDIPVLGESALAKLKYAIYSLQQAKRASQYDGVLAGHLAHILCGGSLNYATKVSTQYLLDLEREAFLKLCGQKKTQERIAHTLKTGKPLRN